MQNVPLQPIPNQIVKTVLGNQNVQIFLYAKLQGLFCDVNANGLDIVTGVLCMDGVPIVCARYNGFLGNLFFVDTQGATDPVYEGLGTRYQLIFMTDAEYASIL
jgi:hypothetical protein